jgi:hypothetical protein
MKNTYAAKLQQRKETELREAYRKGVLVTQDFLQNVFTVALNREGFGKDRILRVNRYVNEVINEYSFLQDEDIEYAQGKLESAVQRIMDGA